MNWTELRSDDQINTIKEESKTQAVVIFKHSTTCDISRMMLNRFERNWKPELLGNVKPYLLDLKARREVSNNVASFFDVPHESPQMLIIKDGKPVDVTSHFGIDFARVKSVVGDK